MTSRQKSKYSLQTNLHYNFSFCHVEINKLQYFLISSILKNYNILIPYVFTLSQQVQHGQNGFKPKKHSRLDANSKAGSHAKLRNFKTQHHHGSKTVVLDNLKFLILRNLLLQTNDKNQQQCLTNCSTPRKGKFSQICGTKKVNTANRMKEKADCYISDSTTTIKMTLWDNFTTSDQDDKTYTSSNVKVLGEFKSQLMGTS